MNFILLIFSICFYVNSAEQSCEGDINSFLFSKDRNVEFLDLTHTAESARENSEPYSGKICVFNMTREWILSGTKHKVVGNIPINYLILPLIIADISQKVNGYTSFLLKRDHLDHMLNNYFGRTDQPCLVVIKFGWTENFVRRRHLFYGVEETKILNHPGISEDVAKWITKSYKNVVGVGVDTPSVDSPTLGSTPALDEFTVSGVYVLGNVKLDHYLPEASCTAVVSPIKAKRSCSPYRLMAICPKAKMTPPDIRLHRL